MSALTERLGIDDQPWMSDPDRNCSIVGFDDPKWAGFHADRWYPTEAHETPELAKTLCGGCPVTEDCFNFAMLNDVEGVWGATTKKQRDEARKMRKCGTRAGYVRHQRAGEPTCADCKAANAADARDRHAKKREAAA
jgi:hypothetical protein